MEPSAFPRMTSKHLPGLSGTALKTIACFSMLLDHIGASCLERGALHSVAQIPRFSNLLAGQAAGMVAGLTPFLQRLCYLNIFLRAVGRFAFPIYCYLLVEGFLHTHSVQKYLLRLLAFALVSEVPFDFAFFGRAWAPQHQNVYFTLLLGLVAVAAIAHFKNPTSVFALCGQIGIPLACCIVSFCLYTDYELIGVVLIVFLYLLRAKRASQLVTGAAFLSWELPAPLAFALLVCYNGERGKCPRWAQLALYCFYPVHLALLAFITNCLILHSGVLI